MREQLLYKEIGCILDNIIRETNDPDLADLRSDPEFLKIIKEAEKRSLQRVR